MDTLITSFRALLKYIAPDSILCVICDNFVGTVRQCRSITLVTHHQRSNPEEWYKDFTFHAASSQDK